MSLRPAAEVAPPFWRRHAAGLGALAAGALTIALALILKLAGDGAFTASPPWIATVPGCALAAAGLGLSVARREGRYYLGIGGFLAALGAVFFGWTLVVLALVAVSALAIAILAEIL